MKKVLIFALLAVALANSSLAWERHSANVYIETQGKLPASGQSESGWLGIQVRPDRSHVELVQVSDFLFRNADLNGNLVRDSDSGNFSPIRYSLDELWDAVQADQDVVAVVPMGYLVQAGVPRVAGYLEIAGREQGPLFNAPQLTAIYCAQSRAFMEAVGFMDFSWQVPYLFAIDFPTEAAKYRTSDLESALVFDLDEDRADQPAYFASCQEQIQLGPRILEPRSIGSDNLLPGRLSQDVVVRDRQAMTRRTVITWARNNWLSIVSTTEPAKLRGLADLISSSEFYEHPTVTCGTGRSISCEFWAVVATSFEHSGIILRDASGQVFRTGETSSTIGAALIIRTR